MQGASLDASSPGATARPRRDPFARRTLLRAALGLAVWAAALGTARGQAAPKPTTGAPVVFLHMNDFHGQFRPLEPLWRQNYRADGPVELVGGAASLAGFVANEREAAKKNGARVVLTDAGDWYQGTLEGNTTKGRLAIAFLNRLGLDASVIGNHEYDFGEANVRQIVATATFPVLGANILVAGAAARMPAPYAKPWQVVDVHGLKVVIVGLITENTKAVSTGPFGDAFFEHEEDTLRVVLPAAKKAGDVVVLLTHCGVEADKRLAAAFPEIPLILGGHSHTALRTALKEGNTWIVQSSGKATSIWRLDARADAAAKKLDLLGGGLVDLDITKHPEDPATAQWITEQTKDLAQHWDRVIGELETPLLDERGVHSTAAGNLMCDAMLQWTKADVAFTNKGGIRCRLRKGPITPRQLYELMPFENTVVTLSMRGADVRKLLESTLAKGKRMLDIGGGSYSYAMVDGERALQDVKVAGAPLDDTKVYKVATSSFLANGGDGYGVFANGKDLQDTGVLLRDVLISLAERDKRLAADATQRILPLDRAAVPATSTK